MKFCSVSFAIILCFATRVTAKVMLWVYNFRATKSNFIFQKKAFFLHDFKLTKNDMFVGAADTNHLCPVNTYKNPCLLSPYINVTLLKDFVRPYLQVIGKEAKTGRVDFEQTLNLCRITSSPGIDVFLKVIIEKLKGKTSFEIKCPFEKVNQNPQPDWFNQIGFVFRAITSLTASSQVKVCW